MKIYFLFTFIKFYSKSYRRVFSKTRFRLLNKTSMVCGECLIIVSISFTYAMICCFKWMGVHHNNEISRALSNPCPKTHFNTKDDISESSFWSGCPRSIVIVELLLLQIPRRPGVGMGRRNFRRIDWGRRLMYATKSCWQLWTGWVLDWWIAPLNLISVVSIYLQPWWNAL